MRNSKWSAFPGPNTPKLWISSEDSVSNALRLYNPYSIPGQIVKFIFSILPEKLSRLILSDLDGNTAELAKNITTSITALLDSESQAISFSAGTIGPHQKVTAQITLKDDTKLYAKISKSQISTILIQNEYKALSLLSKYETSFSHPAIFTYSDTENETIIIQSCSSSKLIKAGSEFNANIINNLVSLSNIDRLSNQSHTYTSAIINKIYKKLPVIDTISNATEYVNESLSQVNIITYFAHGDFTPWNMYHLTDSNNYIIDWEYAGSEYPALFDLVHFVFMQARLLDKQTPRNCMKYTVEELTKPLPLEYISSLKIDEKHIPAYIMLYLLIMVERTIDNAEIDEYLVACLHQLLIQQELSKEPYHVLASAYACDPYEGSEPGVGWNIIQSIAEINKITVITRNNNAPNINTYLSDHPNKNLTFIYFDPPYWLTFWKKGGRGIRTYYYLWQLFQIPVINKLVNRNSYDIAHHVTFVNDWLFSSLCFSRLPFVWGPIGSHPVIPFSLRSSFKSFVKDRLRYYFQCFMRIIDPLYWYCAHRASLIICIENTIPRKLPLKLFRNDKKIIHTAIGVEELPNDNNNLSNANKKLTVLSVGRLIPIKGFDLTIEAFSKFHNLHPDSELTIIGKGPLKTNIIDLCDTYNIRDHVKIMEWMSRDELISIMSESDIFLFPSMEGGGMVVLEAMANKMPVICLDYGGPGIMVNDKCGFKITVDTRSTTINNLSNALCAYANNTELMKQHGINARAHIENNYLWSKRKDSFTRWYKSCY